jgi:hypothetical protein
VEHVQHRKVHGDQAGPIYTEPSSPFVAKRQDLSFVRVHVLHPGNGTEHHRPDGGRGADLRLRGRDGRADRLVLFMPPYRPWNWVSGR